ncbi:MAG: hypothetical protein AB1814_02290 [Thermodesulfobacteriota bacterium]
MTSKKIRQAMRVLVSALLSVCFIGCTPIYLPSSIEYPSVLEASFSPTDNSIAISFFSEIQSGIFLIDDKGKATKWLVGSSKIKMESLPFLFAGRKSNCLRFGKP